MGGEITDVSELLLEEQVEQGLTTFKKTPSEKRPNEECQGSFGDDDILVVQRSGYLSHCWHVKTRAGADVEVCCHCGDGKVASGKSHGPYA